MNTTYTKMAEMSLLCLQNIYAPDIGKQIHVLQFSVFYSQFVKYLLIQDIKRPYNIERNCQLCYNHNESLNGHSNLFNHDQVVEGNDIETSSFRSQGKVLCSNIPVAQSRRALCTVYCVTHYFLFVALLVEMLW